MISVAKTHCHIWWWQHSVIISHDQFMARKGVSMCNWWVFCVSRFVAEKLRCFAFEVGHLFFGTLSVESTVEKVWNNVEKVWNNVEKVWNNVERVWKKVERVWKKWIESLQMERISPFPESLHVFCWMYDSLEIFYILEFVHLTNILKV